MSVSPSDLFATEALTSPSAAGGGFAAPALRSGDRIGAFRVERLLGEGGMGAVYLAEQEQPIRRWVALKLLNAPAMSLEQRARFELERQALARMSHPGIAQIFDAGGSADGRPWFAMECVEGQSLEAFLQARDCTLEARVALLSAIALTVAHAHRKGVLHCDLKPSNVLVTEVDGKPFPKLIDFGIARALGERDSGQGSAGTLAYMSPEQLTAGGELDTRSDVFALGVLLWEALHRERFRPWAAAPGLDFAQARSQAALDDPRRIARPLHGMPRARARELQRLLACALAPEREQRLGSAELLAAELQRWLQRLPLESMASGRGYRLRCLIRRHRLLSAVALVSSLLILALLIGLLRQLQATRLQRDLAEQTAALLIDTFRGADPYTYPEGSITARELLRLGAQHVEARPLAPELKLGLLETLGDVQFRSELYADAESSLGTAQAIAESISAERAAALALQRVRVLMFQERRDEARQLLAAEAPRLAPLQAIEAALLEAEMDLQEDRLDTARATLDRAEILLESAPDREQRMGWLRMHARWLDARGSSAEAAASMSEALALAEALYGADDPQTTSVLSDLASIRTRLGELDAAEALLRRIAAATERSFGADSLGLAIDLDNLGVLLRRRGAPEQMAEALALHRRALELFRSRTGTDSMHTGISASNLASVLAEQDQREEAETLYAEAQRALEIALGDAHSTTAVVRNNRGRNLLYLGQLDSASRLLDEAGEVLRMHPGEAHARYRVWLSSSCERWRLRGEHARAAADCARARAHPTAIDAPAAERAQWRAVETER
jgi:serine/threonine protein kinase